MGINRVQDTGEIFTPASDLKIVTRSPAFVNPNSFWANSTGKPIHPCDALRLDIGLPCKATPSFVINKEYGIGASYVRE